MARHLKVVELIDLHCSKRDQGLSIGEYMLLCAINRALEPVSKLQIADWYRKTVLYRLVPAEKSWLSSQLFWNNMDLLPVEAIEKIEDVLCAAIVKDFKLGTNSIIYIIYDTTNFFTYIDTRTASELPQRGRCKSKRKDLRIVGLALMVTPEFNIPLFHEVYPSNMHDTREFYQVIDKLKMRLKNLGVTPGQVTLALDKGNNSLENINKVLGRTISVWYFTLSAPSSSASIKSFWIYPKKSFKR